MLPVNESDWKLFRKRLPEWQERCMEQLAESYAALLAGPGKASDKFWELEKRLRKDKKRVGVVADVSRSKCTITCSICWMTRPSRSRTSQASAPTCGSGWP